MASNIGTVIEHLAKLQASPAIGPRIGWQETILRARSRIRVLLGVSPGMKSLVDDIVRDEHAPALKIASEMLALYGETPQVQIEQLYRWLGPYPLVDDNSLRSSGYKEVNLDVGYKINEKVKVQLSIFNLFVLPIEMIMGMLNTFAEFERDLLIERTQSGLARAKASGKRLGRQPVLTPAQRAQVRSKIAAGESISAVARCLKTSRMTVSRARDGAA